MELRKPSLLELYLDILKSLEELKSFNLIDIQEKTNSEEAFLKHAMVFLEKQDLIRKENVKNETIYMTTPRGERVTRYFKEMPQEAQQEQFNFA
jgi:predicted transcriptional regulator